MRSNKTPALAIALSSVVLFGAVTFTSAAPVQKKKPGGASAGASAAAGKKVYDANGCSACHVIGGKGGKTGPDLSHEGAKKNSAARLTAIVRDPKATLKTVKMPAYGPDKIKDSDLKALVAYMQSLK